MENKIGIISYDVPHLKTEQILTLFLQQGLMPTIYLLPFKPRKLRQPLIQHRPDQSEAIHPKVLAKAHNLLCHVCKTDAEIPNDMNLYIVGGAGILSRDCVNGKKILNAHPGVIPAARGLDAFKWAIFDKIPLGITLHEIDAEVDKGKVISIRRTCVYSTDTLEKLARRHYENEIDMLGHYANFLKNPQFDFTDIPEGAAHMRMPLEIEKDLKRIFDEYVCAFAQDKLT